MPISHTHTSAYLSGQQCQPESRVMSMHLNHGLMIASPDAHMHCGMYG